MFCKLHILHTYTLNIEYTQMPKYYYYTTYIHAGHKIQTFDPIRELNRTPQTQQSHTLPLRHGGIKKGEESLVTLL